MYSAVPCISSVLFLFIIIAFNSQSILACPPGQGALAHTGLRGDRQHTVGRLCAYP